jgi:hypothetical protein
MKSIQTPPNQGPNPNTHTHTRSVRVARVASHPHAIAAAALFLSQIRPRLWGVWPVWQATAARSRNSRREREATSGGCLLLPRADESRSPPTAFAIDASSSFEGPTPYKRVVAVPIDYHPFLLLSFW